MVPFLLEAVGAQGEVVGIDFAAGMVRQARAKGFGPNCRFLEADAAALVHQLDDLEDRFVLRAVKP